jgi:hypothetical protein
VLGAPLGGVLARFGITAPFWFGFIGSALLVVLLCGSSSTSPTPRGRGLVLEVAPGHAITVPA